MMVTELLILKVKLACVLTLALESIETNNNNRNNNCIYHKILKLIFHGRKIDKVSSRS